MRSEELADGLRDKGMIVNQTASVGETVTIPRERYEGMCKALTRLSVAATGTVVITTERYEELRLAEDKLEALEAGGVDNWIGYDEAMAAASGEG